MRFAQKVRGHPLVRTQGGGGGNYFSQFPMYTTIKFAYGGGMGSKKEKNVVYIMDDPLKPTIRCFILGHF